MPVNRFPDNEKLSEESLYNSSSWAYFNSEKAPVFVARHNNSYWALVKKNLLADVPEAPGFLRWIGNFFSSLHTFGSPVGPDQEFLLKESLDFAKQNGFASFVVNELRPEDGKLIRLLEELGFSKKIWGTFLVDVSKDENVLWEQVKKEARKLVNKAKREGVTVRLAGSEADLLAYYELMKSSRRKLGFGTGPFEDILRLRNHFGPDYAVFLAEYKGKIIAGLGIIKKGGYMKEIGAARDDEFKTLYANDMIKWEIIRWGHSQKCKFYDLGGVNPNPTPHSKEEGIYRFKEKWGGKFCEVYTYSKETSRWKNTLVRLLKRLAGR